MLWGLRLEDRSSNKIFLNFYTLNKQLTNTPSHPYCTTGQFPYVEMCSATERESLWQYHGMSLSSQDKEWTRKVWTILEVFVYS